MADNDQQLAATYREEFRRAYPELVVVAHRSRLMRYVNDGDVGDVLQDICIALWRSWGRVRTFEPERRTAYVLGTAHRRISSYIEDDRKRSVVGAPGILKFDNIPTSSEEIVKEFANRNPDLWNPELWLAVKALSGRQREALLLHYVEDWSVDRIARSRGIGPGTVKTHLSRARYAVRMTLAEWIIERKLETQSDV